MIAEADRFEELLQGLARSFRELKDAQHNAPGTMRHRKADDAYSSVRVNMADYFLELALYKYPEDTGMEV